ncbi:hypothetical protein TNCV_1378671, partial [Trichonephila clavipes]
MEERSEGGGNFKCAPKTARGALKRNRKIEVSGFSRNEKRTSI